MHLPDCAGRPITATLSDRELSQLNVLDRHTSEEKRATDKRELMAKRMVLMLAVTALFVAALGFVKFRQIQTAIGQAAAFQPPPDAVTTIVARQEEWPATLSAIGTMAPVQGVTISADLPGTVERVAFDSGT